MSNFWKYAGVAVGAFLLTSGLAYSASNIERMQKRFKNGLGVGVVDSSLMTKFQTTVTASINLGAGAANVAVTGDAAVTGAALGDICLVAPLLDDAAWDEGSLTCFVEAANDVKIVYHPDATGGDPADMTYRITLIK